MIQIYTAAELPPGVPGMVITEGDETAVLLNPLYLAHGGNPMIQKITNTLLATVGATAVAATASAALFLRLL